MPIPVAVPVPDWNTAELAMSLAVSDSRRKLTGPAPVTAVLGGGALDALVPLGVLVEPSGKITI
jgi:hypothetical protein